MLSGLSDVRKLISAAIIRPAGIYQLLHSLIRCSAFSSPEVRQKSYMALFSIFVNAALLIDWCDFVSNPASADKGLHQPLVRSLMLLDLTVDLLYRLCNHVHHNTARSFPFAFSHCFQTGYDTRWMSWEPLAFNLHIWWDRCSVCT